MPSAIKRKRTTEKGDAREPNVTNGIASAVTAAADDLGTLLRTPSKSITTYNDNETCVVQIFSAKHLTAADGSNGSCDPYVILKWNGREVSRTCHVESDWNPVWTDQKIKFFLPTEEDRRSCRLDIEVWDYVGDDEDESSHASGAYLGGYSVTGTELDDWLQQASCNGGYETRTLNLIHSQKKDQKQKKKLNKGIIIVGIKIFNGATPASIKKNPASSTKSFCGRCGKKPLTSLWNAFKQCYHCQKMICDDCRTKIRIDYDTNNISSAGGGGAMARTKQDVIVCTITCQDVIHEVDAVNEKDKKFRKHAEYIQNYFDKNELYQFLYARPTTAVPVSKPSANPISDFMGLEEDTDADGIEQIAGIMKTFEKREDILKTLRPLFAKLVRHNVLTYSVESMLTMYYYIYDQNLKRRSNKTLDYGGHELSDKGVIESLCPSHLVDYAGSYICSSMWLYRCLEMFPDPRESNQWPSWYLSKLTKEKGYTVIMSDIYTEPLHNKKMCPGYALLVKKHDERDSRFRRGIKGECLLCIRGSVMPGDWQINLAEEMRPYTLKTSDGSKPIQGKVHGGYLDAGSTILDDCNMKKFIADFFKKDYAIKIVGHSLGAAVTSVITLDIFNTLIQKKDFKERLRESSNEKDCNFKWLHGIAYATPAIVTKDLAERIQLEGLILNVINRYDSVPRLGDINFKILGDNLRQFKLSTDFDYKTVLMSRMSHFAFTSQNDLNLLRKPHEVAIFEHEEEVIHQDGVEMDDEGASSDEDEDEVDNTHAVKVLDEKLAFRKKFNAVIESIRLFFCPFHVETRDYYVPSTNNSSSISSNIMNSMQSEQYLPSASSISSTEMNSMRSSSIDTTSMQTISNLTSTQMSDSPDPGLKRKKTADAVSPGKSLKKQKDIVRLYSPGDVIHFYERDSKVCASLISPLHDTFLDANVLVNVFWPDPTYHHTITTYLDHFRKHRIERIQSGHSPPPRYERRSTTPESSKFFTTIPLSAPYAAVEKDVYSSCGICEAPCDWLKADRAAVYSNESYMRCTICEKVVCPKCCDATIECVPSINIYTKRPICAHCQFDSYDIM